MKHKLLYTIELKNDHDLEAAIRDNKLKKMKLKGTRLMSHLAGVIAVGFVLLNIPEDDPTIPEIPTGQLLKVYTKVLYIRGNVLSIGVIMPSSPVNRHITVYDTTLYIE